MLEAQRRGYQIIYFTLSDLVLKNEKPMGFGRYLEGVRITQAKWFQWKGEEFMSLDSLDFILMRKDPPFNIEYIMATYILKGPGRGRYRDQQCPGPARRKSESLHGLVSSMLS